ncbi:hypothetical protein NLI96_g10263 [Meripilus lineatus]|uniref:Cytochrome b5 heme-binding domain-containing protein n=1 Tax=Meripilus lineatus TaxID=2056292 RepID=A0AAD5UU88_9APHY|nr:hypothetical protein NLI96_g10263 [Physisporinus lineatus]
MFTTVLKVALLALPAAYVYHRLYLKRAPEAQAPPEQPEEKKEEEKPKTIMQPPNTNLAPPKDDPFTLEQLREFDGSTTDKPIYVAIKGTIFDVSHKRDTYGKGGSYNIFAGKDASKAFGLSSLKAEDAIPDYTQLPDADKKVLNDWYDFFTKRYNVVGKVIDLPPFAVPSNL